MDDIIEQLRLARVAKRQNQREIAKKLGITPMTFCNWERRETSPTLEKLIAWSALFDMKVTLTNE